MQKPVEQEGHLTNFNPFEKCLTCGTKLFLTHFFLVQTLQWTNNMVDVSALNALIVYVSLNQAAFVNGRTVTHRKLLIEMGKQLAGFDHQETNSNAIGNQLDQSDDIPFGPPKKKRCCVCPSKKDRKTKTLCSQCHENICAEHSAVVCCRWQRS